MIATLYLPNEKPRLVSTGDLAIPDVVTGYAHVPDSVSVLLGCTPMLVDVLASGPEYVAYSVFDSEGEANPAAMSAVAAVSGVAFDADDEDAVLCGPVLLVSSLKL